MEKKIGNIGQFIVHSRYKLETVELEMSRSTQMWPAPVRIGGLKQTLKKKKKKKNSIKQKKR